MPIPSKLGSEIVERSPEVLLSQRPVVAHSLKEPSVAASAVPVFEICPPPCVENHPPLLGTGPDLDAHRVRLGGILSAHDNLMGPPARLVAVSENANVKTARLPANCSASNLRRGLVQVDFRVHGVALQLFV